MDVGLIFDFLFLHIFQGMVITIIIQNDRIHYIYVILYLRIIIVTPLITLNKDQTSYH
jgi:hypothetical protein